VPQVRLIAADGANKGIVDTRDALHMARVQHLDLIEVAPTADPPVCRIFDYGKFIYEREKKEREAKRSQKVFEVKGVRLRPKTTEHHVHFKTRAARRFLEQGNKVKVSIRFKGREDQIPHVAHRMLDKVVDDCADIAVLEMGPSMEGKTMLIVLAPTAATLAAANSKATQTRIERELEEDRAKGYVEDEDEVEDDERADAEVDEVAAEVNAVQGNSQHMTPEEDRAVRKAKSRHKRDENRKLEQFGLP
jgi:translation initiation factor IF-3